MRPSTLFLIASLLALVFGLGFLLAPASVLAVYAASAGPSTVLPSRFFGGALMQLGLSVYLLRATRDTAAVRALAVSGTAGSVCGALVAVGRVIGQRIARGAPAERGVSCIIRSQHHVGGTAIHVTRRGEEGL